MVCSGCHIEYHRQTGCLKQQKIIVSQFWSLRSRCHQGWVLVRPSFLTYRWLPSHMAFLLCSCIPGTSSSSYKENSPRELGPHPMTSFNVNYLLKGSTFRYTLMEVRASTYGFWGKTIQSKT